MSWSLLERFIESDHFRNDPSLAVAYLSRYASHIGIQYVLCSKLRKFSYEQIEFFLPQLCHLLVSADNESMALEEFVLDLCQDSVSGALVTFWLFQTHLHDLSDTPQSASFKTCRRIFNKVQQIVFGAPEPLTPAKIHENVLPVSVLASLMMAGVAAPFLPRDLGPLAIAQARRPQPAEDTISETPQVQQRVARSRTVSGSPSAMRGKRPKSHQARSGAVAPTQTPVAVTPRSISSRPSAKRSGSSPHSEIAATPEILQQPRLSPQTVDTKRFSTSSLPSVSTSPIPDIEYRRGSPNFLSRHPSEKVRHHNQSALSRSPRKIAREEQIHMLRSNYFKSEIQFLTALEGISNRLVVVPKPARLSALRAELALMARDLPAEVDIPLLCPATLENGVPRNSRHHRVVRINPAEATSLNSAERVPYLLMVEVLREDFDFNPDTDANQLLISNLIAQQKSGKKHRLFDIGLGANLSLDTVPIVGNDSVFEPANGDLSSPSLLKQFSDEEIPRIHTPNGNMSPYMRAIPPRSSSGAATQSSLSILSTPRTSDAYSRSSTPGLRNMGYDSFSRSQGVDQQDFSALATHMRTAAQMLSQLDISGSKRPRQEVEAIKSKIIASMQTLEEQSFYNDDPSEDPALDKIMAKVQPSSTPESPAEFEDGLDASSEAGMGTGAGAVRMENDQKTGGVRRKGDRDDPSAATFGEDWKSKRERIRRSSPYGWMKNWDLLSVIVKTGSDLRQEMFACQLIRLCGKVWEDAGVPVWVKQMKILVTGESSGLIETIANGVSLHSLKRSLTLATIAAGTNPRKRIATLKDHFVRTFGEVDSPGYRAAADAFMRSLAAYSMVSYVLQLKDRHNGNILIDNVGHIIHIDFGFMLSNSPGSVGFEAAPFKLTQDYVDVLGGVSSPQFEGFKSLSKQAFQALRKSADNILSVVELMGKESKMACFASGGPGYATASLRQRFVLQMGNKEVDTFVEDLITKSLGSYYTRLYDTFQYRTQGIY